MSFRCAAASLEREDPLTGTATHVRTWLLLEHTGPWGNTALLDARLPDGLGAELRARAAEHRAKVLLIRRFSSRQDSEQGVRVFAASAHPRSARLESGVLDDPRDVLGVDLGALRAGGSSGLPAHEGPAFFVCTNGRHDVCCAERGRPVAQALDAAHPGAAWEVSHVGGDRFAANMVVLPHGLYYGRLTPQSALGVAEAHLRGELVPEHLRGRSSWPMAVQAAEAYLRAELGVVTLDGVVIERVRRTTGDAGDVTDVHARIGEVAYEVRVRTTRRADVSGRLTCHAARENPVPRHELLHLRARRS